ncbi:hypothetical protein JCGZ_24242 [Jatropha curcas]|uniref:Aminotransferase-like plant mobile domain-containing protein n=1 Tax=Jatropha curcas TaxID=180498 RepID=A0A067JP78_JATCU|nr:hypothetical protein JCGZ_24242 [Jatropha curcas]
MCLLEGLTREDLEVEYRGFSVNDFLSVGDFPSYFASRMQAQLPEILEYTQERKTHKTAAHYRAEAAAEAGGAAAPAGPAGVVLGDVPFPPDMEVVLDPGLGLGSGIVIPADLRQAPAPVQLDPEHTTHVPAQRYQEICQRFGFARSYIGRLYSDVHERGYCPSHRRLQCPSSRLSTAIESLGSGQVIPPVPACLIPTYGAAIFQSRSRRRFDFCGNPIIRWTCPWWRIRLVTIGSMNLNYVLYASLDSSMAYFPDRISRQYGMIQRVPRIHNFESGLITPHLLTNLTDRWRDRNTMYLDEGMMQDMNISALLSINDPDDPVLINSCFL